MRLDQEARSIEVAWAGVERLKSVIIWWCNDYSREVVADSIEQY